jgi:DNA processing protein
MTLPPERELTGDRRPPRLLDLPDPPAVLYLRGELPRGPAVAVVGTRDPTVEATQYARQIAAELAQAGVAVLSGGAKGIDTAAHEGALRAGGCTVVVAPSSFDRPSPPFNRELYREILAAGGAYVSLVPPGTAAIYPQYFPRNAVLAALCHAIVLVECPLRSGARNAVRSARRLGRPVFVVPAVPWNAAGGGCILEIQRGARAIFSSRDVLRWLTSARLHPLGGEATQLDLPIEADSVADRILAAVRDGAAHADAICARTGLGPAAVQGALLDLLLSGAIGKDRRGRLRA